MSQSDYIEFILDKLSSLDGVSSKRMFGGHVIHFYGRVLGFVFDDDFYFEPGPTIDRMMPDAERKELFPGSKLFVMIEESISPTCLCELAISCYDDFPISKPRRKKKIALIDGLEDDIEKRFPFARLIK